MKNIIIITLLAVSILAGGGNANLIVKEEIACTTSSICAFLAENNIITADCIAGDVVGPNRLIDYGFLVQKPVDPACGINICAIEKTFRGGVGYKYTAAYWKEFIDKSKTGTVCRTGDECDEAEVCDGNSISCPEDKFKPDNTECPIGTGFGGDLTCVSHAYCDKGFCRHVSKSAGTVCRESRGNCDIADTCGANWWDGCIDNVKLAGTPCSEDVTNHCLGPGTCDGSSPDCVGKRLNGDQWGCNGCNTCKEGICNSDWGPFGTETRYWADSKCPFSPETQCSLCGYSYEDTSYGNLARCDSHSELLHGDTCCSPRENNYVDGICCEAGEICCTLPWYLKLFGDKECALSCVGDWIPC